MHCCHSNAQILCFCGCMDFAWILPELFVTVPRKPIIIFWSIAFCVVSCHGTYRHRHMKIRKFVFELTHASKNHECLWMVRVHLNKSLLLQTALSTSNFKQCIKRYFKQHFKHAWWCKWNTQLFLVSTACAQDCSISVAQGLHVVLQYREF